MTHARLLIAGCLLTLCAGCATGSLFTFKKDKTVKADANNPVVRILALWQPADGQGADGKTTRGFAGQIFFLDAQNQTPAEVDGAVRIYLFDDQGTTEEQAKPIHQFDFPADSWSVRIQQTKMGPAYAVFVPYTRPGHHLAHCNLKIRFTAPNSGPVYSDMANVVLPGTSKGDKLLDGQQAAESQPIRQVAGERTANASRAPRSARATTKVRTADATLAAGDNAGSAADPAENLNRPRAGKSRRAPVPLTERERQRIVAEMAINQARSGRAPSALDEEYLDEDSYDSGDADLQPARFEDEAQFDEERDEVEPRTQPVRRARARATRLDDADDEVRQSASRRSSARTAHPLELGRDGDNFDDQSEEHPVLRHPIEDSFESASVSRPRKRRTAAHPLHQAARNRTDIRERTDIRDTDRRPAGRRDADLHDYEPTVERSRGKSFRLGGSQTEAPTTAPDRSGGFQDSDWNDDDESDEELADVDLPRITDDGSGRMSTFTIAMPR